MHVPLRALALAACLLTLACDPDVAAAPTGTPTAPRLGQALAIDQLRLPSLTFTAGEGFEVHFRVVTPGNGMLQAYGLATRLGTRTFPFELPMPIVANGKVLLGFAGPLPEQNEAGIFDLDFWVVDTAGRESNRLKGQVEVR